MPITSEQREAAAHVLWYFVREGWQPGSFTEKLLDAFARADSHNQFRLRSAFPELGEAFMVGQQESGGLDVLRERFKL